MKIKLFIVLIIFFVSGCSNATYMTVDEIWESYYYLGGDDHTIIA